MDGLSEGRVGEVAPGARGAAEGRGAPPTVIVVGAGVSGCACAAALASAGLHVTLMNSAMDRVGLPAYGPDLIGSGEGWRGAEEALRGLPLPLRSVWLQAATKPASGEAILNIDRRKISVETKRALEGIARLEFRQGFVTDVRLVGSGSGAERGLPEKAAARSDGGLAGRTPEQAADVPERRVCGAPEQRVQVETIFGEVFEADAAVVAVGLSLGAPINAGTDAAHRGRYGEPASAGLCAALETLGAEFREVAMEVGPRASVRSARAQGWLADQGWSAAQGRVDDGVGGDHRAPRPPGSEAHSAYSDGSEVARNHEGLGGLDTSHEGLGELASPILSEEPLLPAGSGSGLDCWPVDYPPAPHWQADLRVDRMVMMTGISAQGEPARLPTLSPDGAATSEVYLAPGGLFAGEMAAVAHGDVGPIASRMPSTVIGLTVVGVSDTGRMVCGGEPGPVWVVGRSAGAQDYAASLSSGVRAARDIARSLGWPAVDLSPGADERQQGCGA